MLTDETQEKANDALEMLGSLSKAAKADAKAAKKRKKERAEMVADAEHALRVIRNGAADEDAMDDHIIRQNSVEPPSAPEPPKAEPTPARAAEEKAEPPKVEVVEKVVDPNPELQDALDKANTELAALRKEAEKSEQAEEQPAPKAGDLLDGFFPRTSGEKIELPKVVHQPPAQPPSTMDQIYADANPAKWGFIAWILAIILTIVGWHVGGDLEHWAHHSMHAWMWFAWFAKPVFAAVGFFLGGLIGYRLTGRRSARA